MKTSRLLSLAAAVAALAIASGCAAPASTSTPSAPVAKWTCKANGLVNANYTGGSSAYIHLSGFSSGGSYAVTKNAAGTEAKGVTANNTPFACTKT